MRRGCLFLNNRYHDPTLGTFISVDPLVTSTGEAYVYASGNPATLSDPTGLEPGCWANNTSALASVCTASHMDADFLAGRSSDWAAEGRSYGQKYGEAAPPDLQLPGPVYLTGSGVRQGDDTGAGWGYWLPGWVPAEVAQAAHQNAKLGEQLSTLDDFLTMSLDEFEGRWRNAVKGDGLDWTNNGCSDPTGISGGHFGCVRHDFLYRNQKRIDAVFGLGGDLRENNGMLKDLIDGRLEADIRGGASVLSESGFRGWGTNVGLSAGLRGLGVNVGADAAFYSAWIDPYVEGNSVDVYGGSGAVRPW